MVMSTLERMMSRPVAKPYRSGKIDQNSDIFINENGHLGFSPGDIENPRNWGIGRKLYISISACILVVNATFASAAPSGSLRSLANDFDISFEAAGLSITLFLCGYIFGPIFFAPLSEFYGRRWIFYTTFVLYCVFNFLCAYAKNFASLLVGRFLTGTFASAPMANVLGVLADLWGPVGRGNAIGLFAMMTFIGPALGPVIAGFLELKKDWRWIYYVILMMSQATLFSMFTIPETLPSVVLENKARRIRKLQIPGYENILSPVEASSRSLKAIFKIALTRPWIMLMDPIAMLTAIYLSFVYSLLYMLFTIYPIVFIDKRGWNVGVGELPLLGIIIGAIIGGCVIFSMSLRDKKKVASGRRIEPEDRLVIGMIGGVGFAISMYWFAWTAQYDSIHWIVPTIAGVFLSMSILMVFVSFLNYLVDTYLMYAASAMACNTIVRSAAGAATPLYTRYMFNALGVGGGGSLVGGVAALLAIIPFAFYKYGPAIRARSRFAPTPVSEHARTLLTKQELERYDSNPQPALEFLPLAHCNSLDILTRRRARESGRHSVSSSEYTSDYYTRTNTPASSQATTLGLSEFGSEAEKDPHQPSDEPEDIVAQPAYETTRFGHTRVERDRYQV